MNIVKFPGLGVTLNVSKIAFQVGNIIIYKYAICIALGIIVGLILAKFSKEKFGIEFDTVLEILIGGIIFGIIGARGYYVLFRLNHYIDNPIQILRIRDGGLAIYGGIIAVILYVLIYCKIKKVNFWNLADYLIPYLALGQCFGRWGNFFNIEAYGSETNSVFRMGIVSTSGYIEVHPVFFYESIATCLIFILLSICKKNRKFEGQVICLYFILYGFIRMFLEGLRVDSLWFGPFRVSQVLSVILFLCFLIIYMMKLMNMKRHSLKVQKQPK